MSAVESVLYGGKWCLLKLIVESLRGELEKVFKTQTPAASPIYLVSLLCTCADCGTTETSDRVIF